MGPAKAGGLEDENIYRECGLAPHLARPMLKRKKASVDVIVRSDE
jgi:hypothetical protein